MYSRNRLMIRASSCLVRSLVMPYLSPRSSSVSGVSDRSRFRENVLFPFVQRLGEFGQLLPEQSAEFVVGNDARPPGLLGGEDIEQGAVLVFPDRLVQRQFPIAQPLVHLDDVALADVQPVGQEFGVGGEAFPVELGLLLLEVVEQLPLILGGPDLDQPEVVQR